MDTSWFTFTTLLMPSALYPLVILLRLGRPPHLHTNMKYSGSKTTVYCAWCNTNDAAVLSQADAARQCNDRVKTLHICSCAAALVLHDSEAVCLKQKHGHAQDLMHAGQGPELALYKSVETRGSHRLPNLSVETVSEACSMLGDMHTISAISALPACTHPTPAL